LRIALVDSFRFKGWYTWDLSRELGRLIGGNLFLYAPKGVKDGHRDRPYVFRGIWSPMFYPFQIVKQARRDGVNILHVQFEFHTFGSFYTSFLVALLLLFARVMGIKVVSTLHGPVFPRNPPGELFEVIRPRGIRAPAGLIRLYIVLVYRIIHALSDRIVVHADVFRRWLGEYGMFNCCVIPHGVRSVEWAAGADGGKVILYFGVLSPRKGVEYLVEAFARLNRSDVGLVLAGMEPWYYRGYADRIRGLIRGLGLEGRVRLTGYVREEDVPKLFHGSMVAVFPHLFSVSASGALALALAYRKPVVATATEYATELLGGVEDLPLVPPRDSLRLAEAIAGLLDDDDLRGRVSEGLAGIADRHSWRRIAGRTLEVYRALSRGP
jgi:glycosyltransferase involved in cell wall biosynthesis